MGVIAITGAAGFLGSHLTVRLAREHDVIAIDRREPSDMLRHDTPNAAWHTLDIADHAAVQRVFDSAGRIDIVIHFAAFYHFGSDRRDEYRTTNLDGTQHVIDAATNAGARRIIFASSIAAVEPAPPGGFLTEQSEGASKVPYGTSKIAGEKMIADASERLPGISLRIGGVFTTWCELPPLFSLMRMWHVPGMVGRAIAGRGDTGIAYIHRDDLTALVLRCIERNATLPKHVTLCASQRGCVTHKELFAAMRPGVTPIHVPVAAARTVVASKCALGHVIGQIPYERPWMLQYVDRPWVVDPSETQRLLGWSCRPELGLIEQMSGLVERFEADRDAWEERNMRRNDAMYAYDGG